MNNTLYTGDNLYILNGLNSDSVDLIYLDPPFNSNRTYSAPIGSKSAGASFNDMWTWAEVDEFHLESMINDYPFLVNYIRSVEGIHGKAMMSYITYMTQRIIQMHRVLKDTGSFYIHIDPTASHYLKVICDRIFGVKNFRNEIIWHYYNGSNRSHKNFGKKHDIILFYSKSEHFTYNYDLMRESYTEDSSYAKGTNYGKKGFIIGNSGGKLMHDVWRIPTINNMSKERTRYPTQKPLALLKRIIKASSKEGDVVFDPFCGCATTCVAAQTLGRKWIGIDIEREAAHQVVERLSTDAGLFSDFVHRTDIPKRTDIKEVSESSPSIKKRLFTEQQCKCKGCDNEYLIKDFEIDHIVPKSKGGGNYYENYQLLCGSCNRKKGNRPMEYLKMRINKMQELMKTKLTF